MFVSHEFWWFSVSLIDASLLLFVAITRITPAERSNALASLFVVAALANLASAYVRFRTGGAFAMINSAILLLGGSAAFVGAVRVKAKDGDSGIPLLNFLGVDGFLDWDWDRDAEVERMERGDGMVIKECVLVTAYFDDEKVRSSIEGPRTSGPEAGSGKTRLDGAVLVEV
ncbi:hypothetical protein CYLTODRAFT_424915 [Cylindrobasidium torrendii FP15055 ss-10]|uniref:Uncharacterized protein n=1 Tax=Cylindrobasidium torrendii FP15055 ss-10 TaxID=1314674 RepID=A0A0D7B5H4_9AGAR|nr:hypothetical protein CYLTODRAFT_424915 [Cylindrobasidium torrendii FP15055 ss-10]